MWKRGNKGKVWLPLPFHPSELAKTSTHLLALLLVMLFFVYLFRPQLSELWEHRSSIVSPDSTRILECKWFSAGLEHIPTAFLKSQIFTKIVPLLVSFTFSSFSLRPYPVMPQWQIHHQINERSQSVTQVCETCLLLVSSRRVPCLKKKNNSCVMRQAHTLLLKTKKTFRSKKEDQRPCTLLSYNGCGPNNDLWSIIMEKRLETEQ